MGGWRIGRDALADATRARWCEVEVDSVHRSEVRNLLWQFEAGNGPGEAYLREDGTCLYSDIWEEVAIWWAIVLRGLTPMDVDLVFCDEG